jgi:hypothetical protein
MSLAPAPSVPSTAVCTLELDNVAQEAPMRTHRFTKPGLLLGLTVLTLPACSASVRSQGEGVASHRPDRLSAQVAWMPPTHRPDRFNQTSGELVHLGKMRPDRVLPAGPSVAETPQPARAMPAQRWVQIDLRSLGVNATLDVPEGAEVRPGPTGATIVRPPMFAIEVKGEPVDFAARIQAIEHDVLRPLQRFVGDAHDTLLYQTASLERPGTVEFHFLAQLESGGQFYSCEDVRGLTFGLAEVETMLRACRSLHASGGTLPTVPNPPIAPDSLGPSVPQAAPGGVDLLP